MGTVQFREDDEVLEYLRSQGVNPNKLSRELLEGRVRRMRMDQSSSKLKKLARNLGDTTALVREAREEHR